MSKDCQHQSQPLRRNIQPQETIAEVDKTSGLMGEELGSDLMKPVAALGDDAGGAQNADVLGGNWNAECRMSNDESRLNGS